MPAVLWLTCLVADRSREGACTDRGSCHGCQLRSDQVGGIDSPAVLDAFFFRMVLAALAGWPDQRQQDAVA